MVLTAAEVASLAGGRVAGTTTVSVTGPVVADSREARPGSLFVAVKGERVDGHDFATAAAAGGAVLAIGAREVDGLPTVVVDDPVTALGRLAHGVLGRLPDVRVVGVTGSVGKTTTKDLLAALHARLGPTVSTPGSYNTEIGLPLTVLGADEHTRFLVLEMGARGVGHVRELCRLAPPRTGLVLNVGTAHIGEFGSRDAVAVAKGELVEALPSDGLAVLNADDTMVLTMAARTEASVVTFGRAAASDVRASDVTLDHGRARFRLAAPQGSADVTLHLVGEHQVANALGAAAVALGSGLSVGEAAEVLSTAEPASRWRMEVVERADGVTFVNDAYNANPESMTAAVRALVDIAGGRRTWAVLGEMRELGAAAEREHEALGRLVVRTGVDRLVVVGEEAWPVRHGAAQAAAESGVSAPHGPAYVADVDDAVALLRDELRPGDVVLVKASRGAGLQRVVDALLGEGGA